MAGSGKKSLSVHGIKMRSEILCKDPRLVRIENFVTPEEAQAIIALAKPDLHPSFVVAHGDVGDTGGASAVASVSGAGAGGSGNGTLAPGGETWRNTSSARTSSSCRVPRSHQAVGSAVLRAAHLAGMHPSHCEPVQVVRYRVGEEYGAHVDYFDVNGAHYPRKVASSGQRVVSCFVVLSACEKGGSTDFPLLGVSVPPKEGTALIWWNKHGCEGPVGSPLGPQAPSAAQSVVSSVAAGCFGGGSRNAVHGADASLSMSGAASGAGTSGAAPMPGAGAGGGSQSSPSLQQSASLSSHSAMDERTLHAGRPVVAGEKWGMNIWLRERPCHAARWLANLQVPHVTGVMTGCGGVGAAAGAEYQSIPKSLDDVPAGEDDSTPRGVERREQVA